MAEEDYTANVAKAAVEVATIIIETIGEAAEDIDVVVESISDEVAVDLEIIIMAK